MALENKTIEEIKDLIITQLEAELNQTIPILPKNFNRLLSKVLAGVFIILYKKAQFIFLQMFVSQASFDEIEVLGKKIIPLVEWGKLLGIGNPFPSQQTILKLKLTVISIGQILQSGTQFISNNNGLIYITQQNYTLSTGIFYINVICTTGGTEGNLEVDQILNIIDNEGYIDDEAIIDEIIQDGIDSESEEEYRQRVVERFQLQPQGGALADYRIWAQDAPGVYQTYIYTGDPPSNVLIYVAGDNSIYPYRVPSAALLIEVGNVCTYDPETGLATRKPVNAIIDPDYDETYGNVLPIDPHFFDVTVFNLEAEDLPYVKNLIQQSLNSYFFEREPFIKGLSLLPIKNKISQAAIIGLIFDIVNVNNGSFSGANLILSGSLVPIESYTLGEGELAVFNILTYTSL